MEYTKALQIAERVLAELRPHCVRAEIAGSIRRKKPEVGDIEIVLIPKPYQTGLFADGIAAVINQWEKVKGELPCKYTQRVLPEGIKLDLFIVEHGNWGLQLAIRTGSAEYSHRVLAANWVARGYHAEGGYLFTNGKRYETLEERDLFERISVAYIDPEFRDV
jgi:DNA polymerase/3'-5' exonuclease PolX